MALVAAALLPRPKSLVHDPGHEAFKETQRGIQRAKELLEKKSVETLIVVSSHLLQPLHAYSATPSDPSAYYVLGLDKLQATSLKSNPEEEPDVFDNDVEMVRSIRERARPFGFKILINPNIKIDETSSAALKLLDLQTLATPPAIVSILLPYLQPHDLFEFGHFLGGLASQSDKKVGIAAVGNLSSRLSKDSPAGFNAQGKVFDELVQKAAKENDFSSIVNADPALLEKAGEEAARALSVVAAAAASLKARLESYETANGTGHAVLTWS